MSTLYQLHANLSTLKAKIKALEMLWQPHDSLLLLGESAAYLDWVEALIADSQITDIHTIYLLKRDIENLDPHTQQLLDLSSRSCELLTDANWVALTLPQTDLSLSPRIDKVVTL